MTPDICHVERARAVNFRGDAKKGASLPKKRAGRCRPSSVERSGALADQNGEQSEKPISVRQMLLPGQSASVVQGTVQIEYCW